MRLKIKQINGENSQDLDRKIEQFVSNKNIRVESVSRPEGLVAVVLYREVYNAQP